MLLYGQDAYVCGYPGEVHLYLDIRDNKIIIHSARSNDWDDSWYHDLIFSEEDTQKILTLLNTTGETDTGYALKERFCPEDNTPETGYDDTDIMGRFLGGILNFFSENNIHWIDESKTWFDNIQQETRTTFYC